MNTVKAKFHYASWFEAGSELFRSWSPTSFEPASVMEFDFNTSTTSCLTNSFAYSCPGKEQMPNIGRRNKAQINLLSEIYRPDRDCQCTKNIEKQYNILKL